MCVLYELETAKIEGCIIIVTIISWKECCHQLTSILLPFVSKVIIIYYMTDYSNMGGVNW